MRAWLRRHARTLLLTGGVLAVIGAIAGWRTWDYIQNDPSFCTSCHLMDDAFGRWQHSGHRDVNCHTCHPGDIASNLHQLWVTFTEQPREVVKHADVPAAICGSCHLGDEGNWRKIGETAGHSLHYGKYKIECVTCHAPQVHTFIPTDAMCEKCHAAQMVNLTPMQRLHCGSCHDFLAEKSRGLRPDEARCAECHGGDGGTGPSAPPWHRALECANCHPVHAPRVEAVVDPITAPEVEGDAVPCSTCHVEEAALHMPQAHACQECHEPHAAPAGEAVCRDCHATQAAASPPR
ncbi:MAG: NapC/NirT family cytochrome c, partial [Myxococcales bacterium]|nr:NapC/NirT family cytochrome c [Myxococcales bacterium]